MTDRDAFERACAFAFVRIRTTFDAIARAIAPVVATVVQVVNRSTRWQRGFWVPLERRAAIVHRDLKPANVLLDGARAPRTRTCRSARGKTGRLRRDARAKALRARGSP